MRGHDVVVGKVVVVVVVVTNVEEAISFQTERLMNSEDEIYGFHEIV